MGVKAKHQERVQTAVRTHITNRPLKERVKDLSRYSSKA